MYSELAFIPLAQLQNLPQDSQMNPNSDPTAMWNPKSQDSEQENEDDCWEVRAFAQDTSNILGTTWPPRSYTCTFCGREFRSAQALGGHMNVHRRDRARLHQNMMSSSSNVLVPTTQEFVPNAGLCFPYNLPQNPINNDVLMPKRMTLPIELPPPSTRLTISPYYPNNILSPPSLPPPLPMDQPSNSMESNGSSTCEDIEKSYKKDLEIEELDLELRLGP